MSADPFDILGSGGPTPEPGPDPTPDPAGEPEPKPDPVAKLAEQFSAYAERTEKAIVGLQDAITRGARPAAPADGGAQPAAGVTPLTMEIMQMQQDGRIRSKADLAKFLDQRAISAPGEVAVATMEINEMLAAQRIGAAGGSGQEFTNRQLLQQFRKEHLADPMFQVVREDFDAMIAEEEKAGSFKSMAPDAVQKGLENLYDIAVGRAARVRAKGTDAGERRNVVPILPTGRSGGFGSGPVQTRGGAIPADLTPAERELVRVSREEYGFDDKTIAEIVNNARAEETA